RGASDEPAVALRPEVSAAIPPAVAKVLPAIDLPPVPAARAPLCEGLDWEPLRAAVAACTACDLHRTRTQTVFGVGNARAEWLVIGEAPGAEEDRQGEPFVGRAGQLLNAMLLAIGLPRDTV